MYFFQAPYFAVQELEETVRHPAYPEEESVSTGPGPPSNSQREASGARGGRDCSEASLTLSCCLGGGNPERPRTYHRCCFLKCKETRRTVRRAGLHPTPPRPGYLGQASPLRRPRPSHGMGAAVSVAALAGSLLGVGRGRGCMIKRVLPGASGKARKAGGGHGGW